MPASSALAAREKYVLVQIEDRAYALPIAAVEEIVHMAELARPPAAPAVLAGFLDVGGSLTAVASLRRLWGLADREPELYTPLVVLKPAPAPLALAVDAVLRIVEIAPADRTPLEAGASANECAVAVARLDGRAVVLLALDRILMEQEHLRLAELADLERRRLVDAAGATS